MSKPKQHIGLLGLGARSTEFYIHQLNKKYHEIKGDYHTFPFILYNIDFEDINPHLPNNFEKLLPCLKKHFKELKKLSIKRLLIPNITLHEALQKFDHGIELIHPIDLSISHLKVHNIDRIVLFGSQFTMTDTYVRSKLEKENIEIVSLEKEYVLNIDHIRKLVYSYEENKIAVESFKRILTLYSANSTVLLACTELSLIYNEFAPNTNVVDMVQLQIEKALTLSI